MLQLKLKDLILKLNSDSSFKLLITKHEKHNSTIKIKSQISQFTTKTKQNKKKFWIRNPYHLLLRPQISFSHNSQTQRRIKKLFSNFGWWKWNRRDKKIVCVCLFTLIKRGWCIYRRETEPRDLGTKISVWTKESDDWDERAVTQRGV